MRNLTRCRQASDGRSAVLATAFHARRVMGL